MLSPHTLQLAHKTISTDELIRKLNTFYLLKKVSIHFRIKHSLFMQASKKRSNQWTWSCSQKYKQKDRKSDRL